MGRFDYRIVDQPDTESGEAASTDHHKVHQQDGAIDIKSRQNAGP
jgi:hypothetical protein